MGLTPTADIVDHGYGRSFDTAAPPEVRLEIKAIAGGVEIRWPNGALEASDRVDGGFATVPNATSPYQAVPAVGNKYYRVKVQ